MSDSRGGTTHMDVRRSSRGLSTYFVLAFAIAWGAILIALGPSAIASGVQGDAALSSGIDGRVAVVFLAMLAGPTGAALLTTAMFSGRSGIRELWSRVVQWRVGARWYAIAVLTTPLVLLAVLVPLALWSPRFTPGLVTADRSASMIAGFVVAGLAAGVFEELGWTGFALPRMLRWRRPWWVIAIGFGVVHTLWHGLADHWGTIALFGDLYAIHVAQWTAALVALRLLIVHVYRHTGSVLLAQLTHASSTGSQLLLGPVALSAVDELLWYTLFVALLWIALGILLWVDRARGVSER